MAMRNPQPKVGAMAAKSFPPEADLHFDEVRQESIDELKAYIEKTYDLSEDAMELVDGLRFN